MSYEGKTKEEIIKSEKRKLREICKKMDPETKKTVASLVDEAAFMAASLYELRQIIDEKGYTEKYKNGANQEGIKKTSEVEIYNVMIKNYLTTVKQLIDAIPKKKEEGAGKEKDLFEEFVIERND